MKTGKKTNKLKYKKEVFRSIRIDLKDIGYTDKINFHGVWIHFESFYDIKKTR